MRPLEALTISAVCLAGFAAGVSAGAQQAMGTVATRDALVTGGLEVQGERAELVSNASVTAHDHTAAVLLTRGGDVLVCATSQFHLLHSGTGQSLLFGLDRGALEIHGATDPQDVILTPDMMFKVEHPGTLDLGLRVTRDGDTCVDNAGTAAPVLMLNDTFSATSYRVMPGQHVLFEHGDLHEVVDNEQSPCGCPAAAPPAQSVAGMAGPAATAAEHPFPAAVSEGLAPETLPANSAPAGEKHTQVAATLAYGPGEAHRRARCLRPRLRRRVRALPKARVTAPQRPPPRRPARTRSFTLSGTFSTSSSTRIDQTPRRPAESSLAAGR